jgi:hypothetical protein
MKHSVPHDLPFPQAKKAADAALNAYRTRFPDFDPQVVWKTENLAEVTFRAMGATVRGLFAINSADVEIEMDVPLLMRPFKAKALGAVEEEIKKWIAKAKSGELDGG